MEKANRKLIAATCLVVAYKFNEMLYAKAGKALKPLFAAIEKHLTVKRRDVLRNEFGMKL